MEADAMILLPHKTKATRCSATITTQSSTEWIVSSPLAVAAQWQSLLNLNQPQILRKGAILLRQGDVAAELLVVATGIVKLVHISPQGRQTISALRYPGQIVDHLTPITGAPALCSAIAITQSSIYRISKEKLRQAERDNPSVLFLQDFLLRIDLHNTLAACIALKCLDPGDQLERLLREIATELGFDTSRVPCRFTLPLANTEVAELLGLSPAHFKKIRRSLELAGRLKRCGPRLYELLGPPFELCSGIRRATKMSAPTRSVDADINGT